MRGSPGGPAPGPWVTGLNRPKPRFNRGIGNPHLFFLYFLIFLRDTQKTYFVLFLIYKEHILILFLKTNLFHFVFIFEDQLFHFVVDF